MTTFLLTAAIDFVALLPFAAFGAIAIGAWVAVDMMFNSKTKSESRLERMNTSSQNKNDIVRSGSTKKNITNMLAKANPKLSDALRPKNEKEAGKLKQKLDEAGMRGENATQILSTLKVLAAGFGFFVGGGVALLSNGFNTWSLVYSLGAAVLFMFLPELILGLIAGSRKQKLFLGLPDALDLMVVCVEAGLGMDQALRRVAEELDASHPVVADEFKLCNQQLQMGSTREIVLTELGQRNGVDDLKTLSSVMIQVDKFGTSVGKALRTQSEAMRTRRRQLAEEKASKTAVKLIFPLVLFIFPGIFVVLVGPAAITMVNEMLPMMGDL
ncbi:MAG: tight adherence protein C [Mariniblastus sp.]|jgi:tight adherence protein C